MKKGIISIVLICLSLTTTACGNKDSSNVTTKENSTIAKVTTSTKVETKATTTTKVETKVTTTAVKATTKTEANDTKGSLEALIKEKESLGMNVVTGTLKKLTPKELVKLQNRDIKELAYNPKVDYYYMIISDKEKIIKSCSGDGLGFSTRKERMVYIPKPVDMEKYVNKKITIAFFPTKSNFPSDVTLPLGISRVREFEILK